MFGLKNVRGYLLVCILLFLGLSTFAGEYSGGDGTSTSPYQIASAEDLVALGQNTSDYGSYFTLTADIDLAGYEFTQAVIAPDTDGQNWSYSGSEFYGSFNGNGHSISGLTIHASNGEYIGLFGKLGIYGEVYDLTLSDVDIEGYNYTGAVAGIMDYSFIDSVNVSGELNGANHYTGSIVGYCSGVLVNNYSTVEVTGGYESGGICGRISYGEISSCGFGGILSSNSDRSGGIAGGMYDYSVVYDCYVNADITGDDEIGGVAGTCSRSFIYSSYSNSSVNGDYLIGGLAGEVSSSSAISDCYALGEITGNQYSGGLCGTCYDSRIKNSYSAADKLW